MIKYLTDKITNRLAIENFLKEKCLSWKYDDASFKALNSRLNHLRETLYFVIEYPYVDAVFRDSYYEYFASKHKAYDRNCVRIVFFSEEIILDDFWKWDSAKINKIKNSFEGFLILRSTPNRPIARSVISPKALTSQNFEICLAKYTIEFFGQKLSVNGFPHISQDGEAITCAESSLWTLLEYYSAKYRDYSPITPSKLRKLIRSTTGRRMIPSNGLTIAEISYAISELGFTSIVYHPGKTDVDFLSDIYTYIESGIPIILGLEAGENFRHAVVCFGHGKVDLKTIIQEPTKNINDISVLERDFIIMDDNFFPYTSIKPKSLIDVYNGKKDAKINYAVVPLNKKIYMDSSIARELTHKILSALPEFSISTTKYFIRLFLTTSRSFKQSLFTPNLIMPKEIKKLILHSSFPRFLWICEIGTKADFSDEKARGLLILDATGGNSNSSVLFYFLDGKTRNPSNLTQDTEIKIEGSLLFSLYKNNLKGEWNGWET